MKTIRTILDSNYQDKSIKENYYFLIQCKTLQKLYTCLKNDIKLQKAMKEIASVLNSKNIDTTIKKNFFKLSIKTIEKAQEIKRNGAILIPFAFMNQRKVYEKTNKIISATLRKEYSNKITREIKDFMKENRKDNHIFYLVSSHGDSAIDHREYQGRMYIDEKAKLNGDEMEQKRLHNAYLSIQFITSKPVWLITRPNCRHYFIALTWQEIEGKTTEELLKKYNMISSKGKQGMKTIKHAINKGWYSQDNIIGIINTYKRRLMYHQFLRIKDKSNVDIANSIVKDKFLIDKWTKYYNELF